MQELSFSGLVIVAAVAFLAPRSSARVCCRY